MKIYQKPEIEIVEFDIADVITSSGPELDLESDEVFFGDGQGFIIQE